MRGIGPSGYWASNTGRARPEPNKTRLRGTPAELIDIEISLLEARRHGEPAEAEAGIDSKIAAWRAFKARTMTKTHAENFTRAIEALIDGVAKPLQDLAAIESRKDELAPALYDRERARLRLAAASADNAARDLLREYADGAWREATAIRARVEVERDGAARNADEMLMARVKASGRSPDDVLRDAADMNDAGQPQRAHVLIEAARSMGGRVPTDFEAAVGDALDVSHPDLASARAIEDELAANLDRFRVSRLKFLASSGIGMTAEGQIGSGSREDATQASIAAKVEAFAVGETSFAVGDGSLSEADQAALYRQPERVGGGS